MDLSTIVAMCMAGYLSCMSVESPDKHIYRACLPSDFTPVQQWDNYSPSSRAEWRDENGKLVVFEVLSCYEDSF